MVSGSQPFVFPPSNRRGRPKSKNAEWEDPSVEGAPFDYNAIADIFYFDVESIGNLEPDTVVQLGIKVLQQKLAAVIQELTGDESGAGADGYEPKSPTNGMGADYGMDHGFTTPFGGPGAGASGGGASAWGGAATPFGATPYGQGGWAA